MKANFGPFENAWPQMKRTQHASIEQFEALYPSWFARFCLFIYALCIIRVVNICFFICLLFLWNWISIWIQWKSRATSSQSVELLICCCCCSHFPWFHTRIVLVIFLQDSIKLTVTNAYRNFLRNIENLLYERKLHIYWFIFLDSISRKYIPILNPSAMWFVSAFDNLNIKLNDILNWGEVLVFSTLDKLNEMAIKENIRTIRRQV